MNLAKQLAQVYFASRDNDLQHVKRQMMKRLVRRLPEEKKKALLARAEQFRTLAN